MKRNLTSDLDECPTPQIKLACKEKEMRSSRQHISLATPLTQRISRFQERHRLRTSQRTENGVADSSSRPVSLADLCQSKYFWLALLCLMPAVLYAINCQQDRNCIDFEKFASRFELKPAKDAFYRVGTTLEHIFSWSRAFWRDLVPKNYLADQFHEIRQNATTFFNEIAADYKAGMILINKFLLM